MEQKIMETRAFLEKAGIKKPEIGIVLGTGLGKLVKEISIEKEIDYEEIPHFPVSTVESHHGKLIYGTLEGKKILAMQGRFHYYEGYSLQEVTFPIRVMKFLGVKKLLLSNAAGAMNPAFKKGSLMLLDDHINFLPENPLRGVNNDKLGPRFPDMSQPYSEELNALFVEVAGEENILLEKGIYVAVMGPNLETRAEYRMFRNYADAVGMSTVPEVIVANHMGLPCAAISVLTDECDPDNLKPTGLAEILAVAGKAEVDLIRLFRGVIRKL
ncbi:MAG: purine-nucleoside phosphorylase [Bacteroidales bacterium]|nr:purine-nucleoside phosphorylase [Bacteroidales bacterium]